MNPLKNRYFAVGALLIQILVTPMLGHAQCSYLDYWSDGNSECAQKLLHERLDMLNNSKAPGRGVFGMNTPKDAAKKMAELIPSSREPNRGNNSGDKVEIPAAIAG